MAVRATPRPRPEAAARTDPPSRLPSLGGDDRLPFRDRPETVAHAVPETRPVTPPYVVDVDTGLVSPEVRAVVPVGLDQVPGLDFYSPILCRGTRQAPNLPRPPANKHSDSPSKE